MYINRIWRFYRHQSPPPHGLQNGKNLSARNIFNWLIGCRAGTPL